MTNLSSSILLCLCISGLVLRAAPAISVEASLKPGGEWKKYPTLTLSQLPAVQPTPETELSAYGGLKIQRTNATGFFYPAKIGKRWWLVDPEGYLFLHKAVCSVSMLKTPGAIEAWERKFGEESKWPLETARLLKENGFNGVGAWSDTERLNGATTRLVYTRNWNFMSSYGKKRGGTYQKPGHTGYPGDCIFVFDPAFEQFCDEHAKQLAAAKKDPWLLGHFSDNEMPLSRAALSNYLSLPSSDPGYTAAAEWLKARHGSNATFANATEQDRADFLAVVVDRYFRIVSKAIRKHDPNHLFLGSRFHGAVPRLPEVFRAAGKYVDVLSVNLYHVWTPDLERLAMWEQESGRPFLITEWYAKGMDSGLPNTSGAGWLVKTQRDRGAFYQNFTLALLKADGCVGWHWFKYIDNDPEAKNVDPSNVDSNKGMLSNRYEPYEPLLRFMKELNSRAYGLRFGEPVKSGPARLIY